MPCIIVTHAHAGDVSPNQPRASSMDISQQSAQDALVSHVSGAGTLASFAKHHGVSRATLQRRLRSMPELQERLDKARRQGTIVAHHAPLMLPTPEAEPVERPEPAPQPYDRDGLIKLLWDHANDTQSRGCAKALGILSEYEFGAEVHAARKAAERDGLETTGPKVQRVIVDLPKPGRVIDAEVVKT